jgi:hypothetical protein
MPDWGDYRLLVTDAADGTLLFRTGFDSTASPSAEAATTALSVRLPTPSRVVDVSIEKRRPGGLFQAIWRSPLDPGDAAIDRGPRRLDVRTEAIVLNGEPHRKVDVAILAEGYTEANFAKFQSDAQRAAGALFSVDPFAARKRDFNVHTVFVGSEESGATDPYLGLRRRTAFGSAYGTGEAERTLAVHDLHALHEAASAVPYDFLLVLVNARRYGGSAYFGGPAVVAADSANAKYLVVHEFAHVMAGLADEYYIASSDGPTYRGNVEPWHPNVTLSPRQSKWTVDEATGARPTPWNKVEYDRFFAGYVKRYSRLRDAHADESTVERLMSAARERQATLLGKAGMRRQAGYFEGAAGYAKGAFRSEVDCIMFSLQTDYFCRACAAAIERMIDVHAA